MTRDGLPANSGVDGDEKTNRKKYVTTVEGFEKTATRRIFIQIVNRNPMIMVMKERARVEKDDIEDQTDQLLADPEPIKTVDCETVRDVLELDQIEQEYEVDEEAGPSTTPQLANVVTTIAKAKLSDAKMKAKLEKKNTSGQKI